MADSKKSKRFMLRRRILLLSLACSLLAVCVVAAAAPAPAPADHDTSISSNGNTSTTTSSVLPLRRAGAGAVAPSAAAPTPAPADHDHDTSISSNGNTSTTTTTTSSVLPLRRAGAGAVAPSIVSTRHDLDTDGRSGSSTLCLHRASTEAYHGVVPLKDGSGRLLCWKRDGQVWLAAVVDVGTTGGSVLRVRGNGKPLIDLRTRVSQDSARGRGLAGVAVDSSSRVFVSYYTAAAAAAGGAFLVVDQVSSASLSEHEATTTRRVFSMALPEPNRSSSGFPLDYYSGQILFRPTTTDPFLYVVTGPAQRDGQLQAKILRFRVDMPSGNGTITPQVYASGLGIPRRCAFDADRPQDLYCAILKGEQGQVYLVSDPDAPSYSATTPSPSLLVAHQRPSPGTPPSLVGGLLYRGDTDTTLAGSYIYMDGSQFWWTVASSPAAARSSSTTRNLRVAGGGDLAGGHVTSFGEDEGNNALLLATDGVYQVVGPSLCHGSALHTQAPKKLLQWVLGAIAALVTSLAGAYGAYKKCKCSCFNRQYDIKVDASNSTLNVYNNGGNHAIQLPVKG